MTEQARCSRCDHALPDETSSCPHCAPTTISLVMGEKRPLAATTPSHPASGVSSPSEATTPSHPAAHAKRESDATIPSTPAMGNAAETMPSAAPAHSRTVAYGAKKPGTVAPKISGYEILGTLGEGGMGAVFLAQDEMLDRKVAIKVISSQGEDKVAEARFLREARSMATAEHPNIVRVMSFGTVDGQPYIVMELVEGESLSARLTRVRRFSPADALRLVRQVIEALAASWQKGIVHRDIKPANILIDQRGNVRVADFGLAVLVNKERFTGLDPHEKFLAFTELAFMRGNDDASERLRSESHFAYENDERFVRLLRAYEQQKTEAAIDADRGPIREPKPQAAMPTTTPTPGAPMATEMQPQPRFYPPPPMYPPPRPPDGGPPPGPGDRPPRPPG